MTRTILAGLVAALGLAASVTPASADPAATYFCRFSTYQGGTYYVQVSNLTVPGQGMCTAPEGSYSQAEFRNIPGLKRRCNLDRPEQITQKHALVSIYSDGTSDSAAAARLICGNTHNDYAE